MDEKLEPLTDDEIRLAYAKTENSLCKASYLKNKDEIEQAYDSLQSGVNFVDLANEFYETAVYDSSAGYLGPVKYFGVDDVFAKLPIQSMKVNIPNPLKPDWVIILYM